MQYPTRFIRTVVLGFLLPGAFTRADVVVSPDDTSGVPATLTVESARTPALATANYAVIPLNVPGFPLLVTDDGTAVFGTNNGGNVYAYRWRQGEVTELACVRPIGTQIKQFAANRNGMVVVVFELRGRAFFPFEGGVTKQVVVAWMPDSTTPVFLNVPIARDTTWFGQGEWRSVDFKFLDDQNRIWGDTNHESLGPEGNAVWFELARWDTPESLPTFIGHRQYLDPSVILLGVSTGNGEPFGFYAPPGSGPYASGFVPFAGSFGNRLNYVPARMNRQGWVLGKRGFTPVLSRDGTEYPLPANNTIALLDDRNNLYDIDRITVWTSNPQTLQSTPENPQTPFIALPMRSMSLPEGYSSQRRVAPGDTNLELSVAFTPNGFQQAIFVPAELRPDANRDGVITVDRWPADPDRVLAEKGLSWHFWVNDDDDSNETDGSDIPGGGGNGQDTKVNGVRDLVDFFPLHLNIARMLDVLPTTIPGIEYRLAQNDGAVNFVLTDLSPGTAGAYHRDSEAARALGNAVATQATPAGAALGADFLGQIRPAEKGVILVEARWPTTSPLRLEAWRGTELLAVVELPLSCAGVETMFRHKNLVQAVKLKPETADRTDAPNWPDQLNNRQAFVFVHGYNVNQKQARGWQAEFFKRLWWSGSSAQFWGVTWYGTESQISIEGGAHLTGNYQANVVHAFGTAPKLADFVRELHKPGTGVTTVNVTGHSLGNIVVSSAISDHGAPVDRYFMIDAAVAAEAFDGAVGGTSGEHVVQPDDSTAVMPNTDWNKDFGGVYPSRLWSTNWYQLFPAGSDGRANLTWRDRFAPQPGTAYFDFHSTGEEVLDYDDARTPSLPFVLLQIAANKLSEYLHVNVPFNTGQPAGHKTWQFQEQLKGRTITGKILGSNFGGWGFNIFHFKKSPGGAGGKGPIMTPTVLSPAEATSAESSLFPDQVLREEPFFRPGGFFTRVGSWTQDAQGKPVLNTERVGLLYGSATGSGFASRHRDALLARMIPAMSPAAGRIAVPKLGATNLRNFDMNGLIIRPVPEGAQNPPWPGSRPTTNWWHSDLREVAYPYVRGLYQQIKTSGNLGEAAP